MYADTLEKLSNSSISKINLLKESRWKYIIASMLAGAYVGLGIFLILTIAGFTSPMGSQFKIYLGLSFGIALSLVIMAGSELFTGNNLVMTAGALAKKVTWKNVLNVWFYSYIGNLFGSILISVFFAFSGYINSPNSSVTKFIINISKAKMELDPTTLVFKGILCNILVCLAVLCCIKMKSESGKLIMIFWCLFAFITSGYEHSIANMSIFATGLLLPHGGAISIGGACYNLFFVTLGNVIGGSLLGATYWFLGRKSEK